MNTRQRARFTVAASTLLLATATALPAQVSLTDNVGEVIGDNGCIDGDSGTGLGGVVREIELTAGGTITDVDLGLAVTHPWRSDLQAGVSYTPEGGSAIGPVALLNAHDLNGLNYYATFDSDAATACAAIGACGATANCTGAPGATCHPDGSLGAFDGATAPGTFTLTVCDGASDDIGALQAWSVTVAGVGDGPSPTAGPTVAFEGGPPTIPTLSGAGLLLLAALVALAALQIARSTGR